MKVKNTLEQIAEDIKACTLCELRQNATCPVPGFGSEGATYYLLGEGPGANEDAEGVPFVGAAGRKLDQLLALANIDPNDVYVANTVRCRPPANRTPKKKEIQQCANFVWRELKILKPKIVITLGSTALSLFSAHGIMQVHGTRFEFDLPD